MNDDFERRATNSSTWGEWKALRLEREKNLADADAKRKALNERNNFPSNTGVKPNAAQDGAGGSPGRWGSLPAPPASFDSLGIHDDLVIRFDRRLLAAVIVLSWMAGFTTAMLLFWEPEPGKGATAREEQVERYEGMGR